MPKGVYKRKAKNENKITEIPSTEKPTLVMCGNNFINPKDVSSIRKVKMGLFIVKMISEPNPEYPLWLREEEAGALLAHFKVIEN